MRRPACVTTCLAARLDADLIAVVDEQTRPVAEAHQHDAAISVQLGTGPDLEATVRHAAQLPDLDA